MKGIKNHIASDDLIDFCSLPQIFEDGLHKFNPDYVKDIELPHHLETEIEENSELCRKIMIAGCHTSDAILRELIDNKDPAKVALYCGFTKFMEEDLALHPTCLATSKKSARKIVKKCAFEMMKVCDLFFSPVIFLTTNNIFIDIAQ